MLAASTAESTTRVEQLMARGRVADKAPHQFAKAHPLDLLDDFAQGVEIGRQRRATRLSRSSNVSRKAAKIFGGEAGG